MLEAFGVIWRHLEVFGGIWRHLEAFGGYENAEFIATLKRLECFRENIASLSVKLLNVYSHSRTI